MVDVVGSEVEAGLEMRVLDVFLLIFEMRLPNILFISILLLNFLCLNLNQKWIKGHKERSSREVNACSNS